MQQSPYPVNSLDPLDEDLDISPTESSKPRVGGRPYYLIALFFLALALLYVYNAYFTVDDAGVEPSATSTTLANHGTYLSANSLVPAGLPYLLASGHNLSLGDCALLSTDSKNGFDCYSNLAIESDDVGYCESLSEGSPSYLRSVCRMTYAFSKLYAPSSNNSVSVSRVSAETEVLGAVCSTIEYGEIKTLCNAMVSSDSEMCSVNSVIGDDWLRQKCIRCTGGNYYACMIYFEISDDGSVLVSQRM